MDAPQKVTAKVRVQINRLYCPHHDLSRVAWFALDAARRVELGRSNQSLVAITLSALALEALANACGEQLVPRWKDFENAPPVAKLRVICQRLGIEPKFDQEPWAGVLWLTKLRNRLAHAKSEPVTVDEIRDADVTTDFLHHAPQSTLEKEITLSNAERAVSTYNSVMDAFAHKMSPQEAMGITSDSFLGSATAHHENTV